MNATWQNTGEDDWVRVHEKQPHYTGNLSSWQSWAVDSHTTKYDQNTKAGWKLWVMLQEFDMQADIMKNTTVNLFMHTIR